MNHELGIKDRKRSGQILILVLLVVVVALAVGLSVASRNLTNLKTSTQAEQSQRAFTAAEGGVEDVLSKLNTVANVISTGIPNTSGNTTCTQAGSGQANCTLQNASTTTGVAGTVNVVASTTYEKTVDTGDVAQINLAGYSGNFTIEWVKSTDPQQVSLEFTFICGTSPALGNCMGDTKVSTAYGQHREAFTSDPSISGQSGFVNATCTGSTLKCINTFSVSGGNVSLLRIKPFHNRVTIRVTPADSASFPVQTYAITSVATTDTGVSRKVQVYRDALPQLPAVFDYVLYSGGDIIK